MLEGRGVVRSLCLGGVLGILVVGAGCAETKGLRRENQWLQENVSSLQQENRALSSQVNQYQRELDRLENSKRELEAKLKGTGATVRIKNGAVSVLLSDSILFDSGQATLRPQSKATLKRVAQVLKTEAPNDIVRIEGHTDDEPIKKQKDIYKSNWELSTARSTAVLHYMVDECGISSTRVYIAGFGQYQPIAINNSRAGKAKNRRVEFVLVPKGDG